MKFTCEKAFLQNATTIASHAAAAKSPIPALEGLLIDAGSGVTISGFDLKTGIITNFDAEVIEPGSTVLNARLFGDIIRKLPDDVVVMETDDKNLVHITCGSCDFNIMGMPSNEYPELPTFEITGSISISQKTIRSMISQTSFAISNNEARPIHTGALLETTNGSLTMVAVDGYRLALRKEKIGEDQPVGLKFVVPGSALAEIEKISSDSDDPVRIALGNKHIMFTIGTTVLISRRLEGEFLNYKNAITVGSKYHIECAKKDIITAVERVSLIISDKQKSPVHFIFRDNMLEVSSSTPLGKAVDFCTTRGDGEGLEIGFNNSYILDALKAAPSEKMVVQLSSGVSPCIMTPVDGGDSFLYMILPVRLRANEG